MMNEKIPFAKLWFIPVGIIIYSFILLTTFIKTWEIFSVYIHHYFAFGVAIGFDVLVLYYSILSVIYPNKWNKFTSIASGFLLWVIITLSILKMWEINSIEQLYTIKSFVGVIISLFIPLTSLFLGKSIGATVKDIQKSIEEKSSKNIATKIAKYLESNENNHETNNKKVLIEYGDKAVYILPKNSIYTTGNKIRKNFNITPDEVILLTPGDKVSFIEQLPSNSNM